MRVDPNQPMLDDDQLRNALGELCRDDIPPSQKVRLLRQMRESSPQAADHLDAALLANGTELRSALRNSSQYLQQLRERIEELTAPPHFSARCLALTETERGREA